MLSCSLVTPYIFLSRAGPHPHGSVNILCARGAPLERRLSRSGEGCLLSLRNPDEIIEQLALLHCLDARVVLD